VLHDVIEDCSGPGQIHIEARRREIRDQFGQPVLDLVEAVSDDKSLPKPERKQAQLAHAAELPHGARLIKLADKTANLRDLAASPPATWSTDRLEQYHVWAGQVVDAIRGTHPGLEALFDVAAGRQPIAA
jgi:guanosine-3',5'-bis(diphosphate) 3'-pyrophosphohydrolase